MNRCRAMVAMQARAFAQMGIGTLVLDPYGTGDSGGDFSGASWALWRDDLKRGIEWLRRHANGCRTLWGIRLGAVMAAELALQDPGIARLLFWQPVVQGKQYFTQFLRIRIAAEMADRDGIKTTDALRERSASGEIVEVSGYRIGPDLARQLDSVRLPDASDISSLHLSWFEVLASAETPCGNARAIDGYKSAGVTLDYVPVIGPAFWLIHERTVAPELIDATVKAVSGWSLPRENARRPRRGFQRFGKHYVRSGPEPRISAGRPMRGGEPHFHSSPWGPEGASRHCHCRRRWPAVPRRCPSAVRVAGATPRSPRLSSAAV